MMNYECRVVNEMQREQPLLFYSKAFKGGQSFLVYCLN